jgi:hypothetical protein
MTAPRRSVVLFDSVSAALSAEKVLKETGFAFKLIPVPKYISSDCGVCVRIETADAGKVKAALAGKVKVRDVLAVK